MKKLSQMNYKDILANPKGYEFDPLSKKIIGLAIVVHKEIGPGYIERIYHNALKYEFINNKMPYETEKIIEINYKNKLMGMHRLDLIVNEKIVVEIKAIQEILGVHISHVISYLKATGNEIGLILNFSKSKLDIKRVKHDKSGEINTL
jgi:GxxExxY protein